MIETGSVVTEIRRTEIEGMRGGIEWRGCRGKYEGQKGGEK